jgi:hypothetical protein
MSLTWKSRKKKFSSGFFFPFLGEGRREKGEGRREKGEGRREKGEEIRRQWRSRGNKFSENFILFSPLFSFT